MILLHLGSVRYSSLVSPAGGEEAHSVWEVDFQSAGSPLSNQVSENTGASDLIPPRNPGLQIEKKLSEKKSGLGSLDSL
jgi:hypothetical protein